MFVEHLQRTVSALRQFFTPASGVGKSRIPCFFSTKNYLIGSGNRVIIGVRVCCVFFNACALACLLEDNGK
jgi:hypothetical protein